MKAGSIRLFVFLGLIASPFAEGASFFNTGRLFTPRRSHTATLLPNGRVLVAGGWSNGPVASAELYDPATGAWTVTGALASARYSHTAVLLPTGKVLVAGGTGVADSLGTAELYDPATGVWTATGALTARSGHTATLLRDGRVLVAGGRGAGGVILASSQIFDPGTGVWASTNGNLAVGRADHTAVLLPDGRVEVTGGFITGDFTDSREVFDPATGLWSTLTTLVVPRRSHTATLLPSGALLATGGCCNNMQSGGVDVASAEQANPATGAMAFTASLTEVRRWHSATLLPNGRVLVVGGEGRSGDIGVSEAVDARTSAQVFDPGSGTWGAVVNMSQARSKHTATLLPSGQVLIVGGIDPRIVDGLRGIWDPGKPLSSAEIYDDGTLGSWTTQAYGSDSPSFTTATTLPDGRVLLADATQIVVYDPSSGAKTTTALPGLGNSSTLLPSGKVLLVGTAARIFDPALGTSTALPAPPTASAGRAALLADGRVLVVGGTGADLFDPAANAGAGGWTPTSPMSTPRTGHTMTTLADGTVLVAGGQNGGVPLLSAEVFDPAGNGGAGSWRATGFLTDPRIDHAASLLPDGSVLVAGGRVDQASSAVPSSEIYDAASGSWTRLATGGGLFGQTPVLLLNGKVLLLGGATPLPYFRDGLVSNAAWLFDPASRSFVSAPGLSAGRYGPAAALLPDGRVFVAGGDHGFLLPPATVTELYEFGGFDPTRRPQVTSSGAALTFGVPFALTGTKLRGDAEGGSGGSSSVAANYPVLKVQALEGGRTEWLTPDARANFSDEPMSLSVSRLPATLNPGYHVLSVVTGGVRSSPGAAAPQLISVTCSVAITTAPANQTVALGGSATFTVVAQGARRYQWRKDGIAIPGATGASYTTPPVAGADSGSQFSVVVTGACATATSAAATLIVADVTAPTAAVVSPNGGEYWLLSEAGSPAHQEVVTWSMSDNVRICLVEVSLLYSNDGGASYLPVPAGGGLPASYGAGGTCSLAQAVTTTSLTYTIPTSFPSGVSGSLYKVQVRVTDHVGLQATALIPNPFYIVRPNPDSVKTLILSNTARMQTRQGVSPTEATALAGKLQEVAAHPRVLGLVVDLNGVTDITNLYAAWDADPGNADKANAVLFGCHAPLPPGCTVERNGIHDQVRALLGIYSGVKYLILAGDDRIIPFARLQDRTSLLSESSYPAGGDLTPTGTTVGRALSANKYLSDDPLAVADPIRPDELSGSLFLPDLAVGRLVETPGEMTTAIATFISQDGVLDLSALDPITGHKVLVTGYDFLSDSAVKIRERWKAAFGVATPVGSPAPVDGSLVGGTWGLGSVAARVAALRTRLLGNGGARYGLMSLAGHATHYEEGVPGTDPFDIQGLPAQDLYGTDACATPSLGAVDLAGAVVYAVGCHSGLAVAGSCATDANHSLDLPQTMLARGVVSYVANTGYGWGLRFGIGYGERLVDLLSEEMTKGGTVVTGDAVKRTKQRYFLETPRYDSYDEKSLMQWTLYGLPMYAVKTGVTGAAAASGAPQRQGRVGVSRSAAITQALPSYLTQLNLSFDFTAPGVYTKRGAAGDSLSMSPGCADPDGCYYTLNGLVERSSGAGDLPIQPYFIYDSRLSGTSQHGVLWKGGTYDEETGWKPVFGELQSNGGDGSNHGAAPRLILIRPTAPRVVPGADPETCRPSDLELNSLVVGAGEAAKPEPSDLVYSIERRYRNIDLEALYFNNTSAAAQNCDRQGPDLAAGPFGGNYHQVSGSTVTWAVPATDASGVWRVLVVSNDNSVDVNGRGTWTPLDLVDDGTGTFRGSRVVSSERVTYVIQAVDNRGNVTWLDYVTASLPSSGVPLGVPRAVDAAVVPTVTVSGFAPAFGVAGTSVVVTGTHFTGATAVTFGGKPAAAFVVDSSTQITATVPAAAVSGPVAVTAPLGTGTSASIFTVVAPPTVTSFTPTSGPVGVTVAVTGTNFTGVTEVAFGGTPAVTVTVGSPSQLSAVVPSGASTGKIAVTTGFGIGTSAADFLVTTPMGTRFYTIPPCRVVDTRTTEAPALSANVSRTFAVAGHCGIPPGAQAVSLNVTVTGPAAPGNLRLFPAGTPLPSASALNYSAGQTRGNNAIIPLSGAGELSILAGQASGTTQVILDLNGYFE
jgi:hypothetical protein